MEDSVAPKLRRLFSRYPILKKLDFFANSAHTAIVAFRERTMKKNTQYAALLKRVNEATEKHPQSFVVLDGNTLETLATGRDAAKTARQAKARLKSGHVPVICKRPRKNDILIY